VEGWSLRTPPRTRASRKRLDVEGAHRPVATGGGGGDGKRQWMPAMLKAAGGSTAAAAVLATARTTGGEGRWGRTIRRLHASGSK